MARLKEDTHSWHARSIMRRDARHDLEEVADKPSTGKRHGQPRKHVKHCQHEFVKLHDSPPYYSVSRCVHCAKREYNWYQQYRRFRTRWRSKSIPTSPPNPHNGKAFPIHEPGLCEVCDALR